MLGLCSFLMLSTIGLMFGRLTYNLIGTIGIAVATGIAESVRLRNRRRRKDWSS